ncbi:amidohydrolase family protein [Sediminispirochaeta smaragdinae]|uniref:Amidohydrolase n=1 Tax=Sediminispirochaeta smaragdinae (strain DSM 11293 / JCM 15392 / SEBR 4228) TaxID=573413 RepID=E1R880_SEDSS|nr:amidohydrolase family protein [Sediminispirochaeta smaragdinae]ADK82935.1 amidohydrolase [Sediminispirochaeta smaragdinae DSM 11293]
MNEVPSCRSVLIYGTAVLLPDGWIEPGYIYLKHGVVEQLGAGDAPQGLSQEADTVIHAPNRAVVPGLTNAHTHFAQTFMRGLASGRPLLRWLKERIWPLQAAFTADDMNLAARLGILENIRCGATHITDHHKVTYTPEHTHVVCKAADDMGVYMTLARSWSDIGAGAEEPRQILDHLASLYSTWKGERIAIANGPLAAWRCSARTLLESHELALNNGSFSHIHIAESLDEMEMSGEKYQMSPFAWLDSLGILDARMQLVHAVWADEHDVDRIAGSGAIVIHCPVSNEVLGSGIAPLSTFLARDVRILLGTDGPASNDTQDIFETIKASLLLSRVSTHNANSLSPTEALHMALDGRRIEKGGAADLIIVNLDHPRATPVHDYDSALTLCCHGSDVETVIVDGKILMYDNKVLVEDEESLLSECRERVKFLRERVGLE